MCQQIPLKDVGSFEKCLPPSVWPTLKHCFSFDAADLVRLIHTYARLLVDIRMFKHTNTRMYIYTFSKNMDFNIYMSVDKNK